jgi:hypothetical protein
MQEHRRRTETIARTTLGKEQLCCQTTKIRFPGRIITQEGESYLRVMSRDTLLLTQIAVFDPHIHLNNRECSLAKFRPPSRIADFSLRPRYAVAVW